jgi:acyl-coenzyme A thioesterase PaaI-like protein
VVHRGRGLAYARAEVTDSEARLLALADASALILPGRRADLSDAPPLG